MLKILTDTCDYNSESAAQRARSLAIETQPLRTDADRGLVLGLARKLNLPRTVIVQTWAEIDHAARGAA